MMTPLATATPSVIPPSALPSVIPPSATPSAPAPSQAKMVEVPDGYSFVPFLSLEQAPKVPFQWDSNYAKNCNAEKSCTGYNTSGQGFNKDFKKHIRYTRGDPTKGSFFKKDTDYNFFCRKIGGEPTGRSCKTPTDVNERIAALIRVGMVVEPFESQSVGIHPIMMLIMIIFLVWLLQQMKK